LNIYFYLSLSSSEHENGKEDKKNASQNQLNESKESTPKKDPKMENESKSNIQPIPTEGSKTNEKENSKEISQEEALLEFLNIQRNVLASLDELSELYSTEEESQNELFGLLRNGHDEWDIFYSLFYCYEIIISQ